MILAGKMYSFACVFGVMMLWSQCIHVCSPPSSPHPSPNYACVQVCLTWEGGRIPSASVRVRGSGDADGQYRVEKGMRRGGEVIIVGIDIVMFEFVRKYGVSWLHFFPCRCYYCGKCHNSHPCPCPHLGTVFSICHDVSRAGKHLYVRDRLPQRQLQWIAPVKVSVFVCVFVFACVGVHRL